MLAITFGLIKLYWKKKYKQEAKNELSISEKISFNINELLNYLGGKENIKNIMATYQTLKFEINDNLKIDVEKIKNLKGISGVVNNSKKISVVVGNSAKTIKDRIEAKFFNS